MRRFTNSELTTWRTCRRQWWLRYYRQLAPVYDGPDVSAAGLGTLVHLGLEVYHWNQDPGQARAHISERIQDDRDALISAGFHADSARLKAFEKQSALALVMMEGYFQWLEETGADADLEFVAAEEAVEVDLGGGRSLLGKLDAIVRKKSTGELRFLDNKTVQSIDQTVESAYRSNQFRTYAVLQREKLRGGSGELRADGVILNMLRKVGRGPTSKPPFYGRHEFSFNEKVVAAHWEQVIAEIDRIEEVEELLGCGVSHHRLVPPSPSRDCSWRCEFKSICPMFDDGSDVDTVLGWGYTTDNDPLSRYADASVDEDRT